MATTASSSSASRISPYIGAWGYDVFLCFRGDDTDTHLGFISHLLKALSEKQIRTFIDQKLEKTETIDELIPILERCSLSVVVFSEKFPDSSWCLDEVATIAGRMTEFGHQVLPVFYKVDSSEVVDDSGGYATTINREHKSRKTYAKDKKRWIDALKYVATSAGHTSHAVKSESELIKAIVKDVQKRLINMGIKSANLVCMGSRILEVEWLLDMDTLDDTRIIGLLGMAGVGKTTLARACYDRVTLFNKGIKHLFLPNINERCEMHQGLEEIFRELYSKLLDENNIDYEDLDIAYRRRRLSRLRVFIVLDDVETSMQLEYLTLGNIFNLNKVFAAGSRILVTTRNKKVLQNAMARIYNVECLNDEGFSMDITNDDTRHGTMMTSPSRTSSASHSSPYTREWDYDVFLCFRGADTHYGFTSHLMAALSDRQIKTFIRAKLKITDSIDELIFILQRCALSVVVFSENFADSSWCLDEVAALARTKIKFGHQVLPVFYKVDPLEVTDDSRSYATAIDREYKGRSTYVEDKKRWMDALKSVASAAGYNSQAIKNESELIKTVVEDVHKKLVDMSPSIESTNLVGMDSRIFEVERLLAMDTLEDTRIIGLWGMGGVGKTTLAKACYDQIISSSKGIKYHFIGSIGKKCRKRVGVEGVVNELYSKLLSENNMDNKDLDIIYLRLSISRLKVFIVLDDVETPSQLEEILLGDEAMNLNDLFAPGSKIIVTTRDKRVLDYAKAMIYTVGALNDSESIQLFSLQAFRKYAPPRDWEAMSRLAASYCKGNPLALKVLGATLVNQSEYYWQSFLGELKLIGNPEIHEILEKSYEKLGDEEKRLFMDVACFLHGISGSRLIVYMSTMYPSAYEIVEDLIDRTLLIRDGEKIEVHDLLRDMAWDIVNKESKVGKRSRLVDPDDIHKLLTTPDVNSWATSFLTVFKEMVLPRRKKAKVANIQGISLDLHAAKEMYLEANAFDGMNSLTFLSFSGSHKEKHHLPHGGLNSLPDGLRWLEWDGYPSKSLPSKFYPQHLVHLTIRNSPILRCWEGYNQPRLVNLIVLDLSFCGNLTASPDISSSSNLEELILYGCESLTAVPSYVQYFTKLIALDLCHCRNLKRLPPKLDSKLLQYVGMRNLNVTRCPTILSRELLELDLRGTSLQVLPVAIYNVKQDGVLRLGGINITKFPAITRSLKDFYLSHTSIREIDLSDYSLHQHHEAPSGLILPRFYVLCFYKNLQLKSLLKCIWKMVRRELEIHGSPLFVSLPEISEPVFGLTKLSITACGSLESLPSSIGNIRSLQWLNLSYTGIKSLPSSTQELRELVLINLSYCKSLESIPSSIYELSNLKYFYMNRCVSIRSLSELPPNLIELEVNGCKSLQALPSNTGKLLHLESLHFEECPQLDQTIPTEIVTNFPVHASLSPSAKCEVVCSRSELPEWLMFKSMNLKEEEDCTVELELPLPNDSDRPMIIKGIAFGLVFSSHSWVDVRCDFMAGNNIITSWYYDSSGDDESSENLWLRSEKKVMSRNGDEEWYVKYAGLAVSFHFYFRSWSHKRNRKMKIKRCGVSLLN